MLAPTRGTPLSGLIFTSLSLLMSSISLSNRSTFHLISSIAQPYQGIQVPHFQVLTVTCHIYYRTQLSTYMHRETIWPSLEISANILIASNDQQTKEKWKQYLYFVKWETIHILSLSSVLFMEWYYRSHYREHSTVLHSKSLQWVVAYSLLVIILILTHSSLFLVRSMKAEKNSSFFPPSKSLACYGFPNNNLYSHISSSRTKHF